MIIQNGDHAEFELEHKDTPPHERPDWPYPSVDAKDWATAFRQTAIRLGYSDMDEGWLIGWFANAIMRGFDEQCKTSVAAEREACARIADEWVHQSERARTGVTLEYCQAIASAIRSREAR